MESWFCFDLIDPRYVLGEGSCQARLKLAYAITVFLRNALANEIPLKFCLHEAVYKLDGKEGIKHVQGTESKLYDGIQTGCRAAYPGRPGVHHVARELGILEQTLRNWVKAEQAGKLNGTESKPVRPEQMELSRIRAGIKCLQMELEIAKKAVYSSSQPAFGVVH